MKTGNLLRIAIFNISYIRGLFPEKYFNDKSVPALDMKIKKLMPMDGESRFYDALQTKYLKTLLFYVLCEAVDGPIMEKYAWVLDLPSSRPLLFTTYRVDGKCLYFAAGPASAFICCCCGRVSSGCNQFSTQLSPRVAQLVLRQQIAIQPNKQRLFDPCHVVGVWQLVCFLF